MRFCVPEITGRRGAGLANELNGWAKAYIASRVLNAKLMSPAWGLNPRGYRAYFRSSPLDWAYQAAFKQVFPTVRMSRQNFNDSYGREFRYLVEDFAHQHSLYDRKTYVFAVGGMWGGKGMLREAFPFIRSVLLAARGTVDNLADIERHVPPDVLRIAVHVRRGDFAKPSSTGSASTGWNTALPIDWYLAVCRSITRQLPVPHRYLLFSDGTPQEIAPLLTEFSPLTTWHQRYNVCSDLIAMSDADLLVTSCSSFSLWAAALSGRPYIWHANNLVRRDGVFSMWDHGQPLSAYKAKAPRGVPVGDAGEVSYSLIEHLQEAHSRRGWGNDLVFYGALDPNP